MKKVIVLWIWSLLIPILAYSQLIEDLEYISPFNDDVSAVKKNGEWGFINGKGDIVVDFRDDLYASKTEAGNYPIFMNGRCKIFKEKNGIKYFGYIDKTGRTIIEPKFLNATNFIDGKGIVLELEKETAGKNKVLGKNVVYYRYFEVLIDTDGEKLYYLDKKGINVLLDKKFLPIPPQIRSKFISKNLIATIDEHHRWVINKIDY